MNHNDDSSLDAALEALARQGPPRRHVERVLARTGVVDADGSSQPGASDAWLRPEQVAARSLRPRWLLPIAATALFALSASWHAGRSRVALPAIAQIDGSGTASAQGTRWDAVRDIDRPVLPPEAYWGMDPFAEFATLRPGAFASEPRSRASRGPGEAAAPATDPGRAATALPPIEMADIAPAPIEVAPLAPLDEIALAEIPLAPIATAPFIEEENP